MPRHDDKNVKISCQFADVYEENNVMGVFSSKQSESIFEN